jgi:hypothetical protein
VLGQAPAPPEPAAARPSARLYPSAADAVAALLGDDAGGVVAFGEVHQDRATASVRSALARFRDEILPAIAPRTAHLVVETWVARGDCGAPEAQVTADVAETTQRPPETESEIVGLIRRAKEAGVTPHILDVTCDEYAVLTGGGTVDYEKLLAITTRHLAVAARQAALLPRSPERPLVVIYGGALHNDLHPRPVLAAYTFAPSTFAFMHGAFREIDLYVPELVQRLPAFRAEPWFPIWRRASRPNQTVLITRSPHSAIVVFPAQR